MRIVQALIVLVAMSSMASAAWYTAVPEVDGGTTVTAMALLSGALMVVKSRLKK